MAKATVEGLNYLLNAGLKNGARTGSFYVGLLTGDFTESSLTTSATLFAGGATECVAYAGASRKAVTLGDVAAGAVAGTPVEFILDAGATITGVFLCSGGDKGGAVGTLLGVHKFSAAKTLMVGESLTDTPGYTLSAD